MNSAAFPVCCFSYTIDKNNNDNNDDDMMVITTIQWYLTMCLIQYTWEHWQVCNEITNFQKKKKKKNWMYGINWDGPGPKVGKLGTINMSVPPKLIYSFILV